MGAASTNGGLLYNLTIGFIRFYKAFEAVIIRMFLGTFEKLVRKTYREAGIEIDGNNPWDIRVHNKPEFFLRLTNHAPLGLGESYIDGVWECQDMIELNYRTMRKGIYRVYMNPWNRFLNNLEFVYFNMQTERKAWEVGEKHYNLGNDLFEAILDPSMNYSCAYWARADNLHQAQIDKMDLIAKKLNLKPGMKILDIGCGWGGLSRHLAENYGVSVVGITVSEEGQKYARDRCSKFPVDIRLMDYRDLDEQFDRIVSVGMFEHVGPKNYGKFFETANRCLKDDGIFLLHTIGISHSDFPLADAWFDKYIFPNGILPSFRHISEHIDGLFVLEDWHNFGYDYYRTLSAWYDNFEKNFHKIESKYGDKFFRMFKYYLLMGAGAFKSRKIQLWQVCLSKNGIENGYYAAR